VNDNALERAKSVRLMVFDVDGTLTDGTLYLSDTGAEMKAFNVRDGHGLKMLQDAGIEVAILTARRSRVVQLRAAELGIRTVIQGASDKAAGFGKLLASLGVQASDAGYMGDDLPDLPVLEHCGFAASVPEAPASLRERVHYVTKAPGGRGAAREVCEFILRARGALDDSPASRHIA
jgi:3-deoxy-D-manno-octulosonate 8-phosphate phosphatase (KDO 8-P phosphatase)